MKGGKMSKFTIDLIFKNSEIKHGLKLFNKNALNSIKIFDRHGKPYLTCFGSDKERPAKPEEIVRQLFIRKLMLDYGYPKERIAVEKEVWFGSGVHEKTADIVIFHKDMEHPYIIIEVKKPERKDGLQQLKSYCNAEGSPIGVWSNGKEMVILHREEPNIFSNISDLPTIDQTLIDVIKEPWTIEKLAQENKLAKERLSLKSIIQDLENLVLANAGVDAFDEVFKLIYAKLFDEWAAKNLKSRNQRILFRIYGESPSDLYEKINSLFVDAKNKWQGVFRPLDDIELSPTHLYTCVSFLQDIKLFNANLQIIDEAFEYLVTQVAKGSKGQFFTPRYVIDMCVKMLNPKENEYVIDTAAGSCGFTVHTIFWVWGEGAISAPTREQAEYAATMVYGIDFDGRAVKIAKALNLIAGDGKQNVYKLNTLDSKSWNDEGKAAFRKFLVRFPKNQLLDRENQKEFKYFNFNVLMTNPPFAGEINEKSILRKYDLAEKGNGRLAKRLGRHILFIERNLNFLKDGGRMAIILPQGIFNNSTEKYVRDFIMKKARILAVVSLGQNTFKPHTGTKTSVLFLQKWDDKLCPKRENYPIFFAVSEKAGKNNSGEYVFAKDKEKQPLIDKHGHLIVNHDLEDIASQFIEFAKKEKLSFW
jgi:type I restriction enzyme M protein